MWWTEWRLAEVRCVHILTNDLAHDCLWFCRQDQTWWSGDFIISLNVCDRAAAPTFPPSCSIPAQVSCCFLCMSSLRCSHCTDQKRNFFPKIVISFGSVSCCGLSCSCLGTRPISRAAMGLHAGGSLFSSHWSLDQCMWTRRIPVWYQVGAGHKTGL